MNVQKLHVSGLDFYYGAQQALFDVSLDIPEKRVTALIGPSGCCKSTFLRTLNRMYETVRNARAVGEVRSVLVIPRPHDDLNSVLPK